MVCVLVEDRGFETRSEKIFKLSLQYGTNRYRFRLGTNSGVDDQLDAVTSVSGRSRCLKRCRLKIKYTINCLQNYLYNNNYVPQMINRRFFMIKNLNFSKKTMVFLTFFIENN
ncbi:hypothetical protein BpHYR1_029273 [Brachionus plicatilis]|uniref:Uncharacterized protein n=1 Tax=Brachionus plicatilis TaxID=10195 RepID=A0A3M7R9H7_BRAPC|nr:hypothetical protein BpHYR1_029273 [Brachionus plicatilis]